MRPVTEDGLGLCLLRALEIVLKSQPLGASHLDSASITDVVKVEILTNIEYYSPLCVTGYSYN